MLTSTRLACACLLIAAASGCGGGGGGGGSSSPPPGAGSGGGAGVASDFSQGIFRASSTYKNLCAIPRRGSGFPDRQGTTTDENDWLRAWSHDLYLWYDEIEDADPALSTTPDYFELMRTFASTPSGAPKDQFHFTFDTEEWEQLSQSGVSAGYGVEWLLLAPSAPREILVGFVEPGSPAAASGLVSRGARLLAADGIDAINASGTDNVDALNAALFPDDLGESHTFTLTGFDGANERTVTLTSASITQNPVPVTRTITTPSATIGYLLFNAHIATAERALVDAIEQFRRDGVTELILDLRYNGGGFLDIANELGSMIAGPAAVGQVFESIQFNDKHPSVNPVTGQVLVPNEFYGTAQGFSVTGGTPLPALSLSRVFVLSTDATCSASESIVNGLRGIDFEVVLIGEPTCGKPYGFYATDNCGTTYFTIQFRGANAKGFGDYADGFLPRTVPDPMDQAQINGCPAEDDFSQQLGNEQENLLETALAYIDSGACPSPPVSGAAAGAGPSKRLAGGNRAQARLLPGALGPETRLPGRVLRQ
ncbi:MAG: S41 family peptidase [Pseudomonadota bacterium]